MLPIILNNAKELHIYMEFMASSLHQILQQRRRKFSCLSVMELYQISYKIAEGLKYLHELDNPVIHRDIKSKNVSKGSFEGDFK